MDGADDPGALRPASITIDDDALERARLGFHRAAPSRSAKRVFFWTQLAVFSALGGALYLAIRQDRALTCQIALAISYALFAATVAWRFYAAANITPVLSRIGEPKSGVWPSYTLLCPLYGEADVVAEFLASLNELDYPRDRLDVKLLVESDDLETIAATLAAANGAHIEVVIVPALAPRTKPKAINAGLERARGDLICVYDAEDRPHPLQLRAAALAFDDGGPQLACVQAPLAIDTGAASWISRQFAAEYAIQFREIVPMLSRLGLPLPLGGSSNHFRTHALRAVGGWDAFNVTEDIDLGYRLARDGWRAGVISPPTWEEAPVTLGAWLKQRARWIKGHLHTWLILMRDPFRTAREMGAAAFWSMQLTLGGGLAASFLHAPFALYVLWAMISPSNVLGPHGFILAVFGYCTGLFSALTAAALARDLSHVRAIPTMPLYWTLSTVAAVRAFFELLLAPSYWSKTRHGLSPRPHHDSS